MTLNLTDQEIFERVSKHLFSQNKRAGDFDSSRGFYCLYRDAHGRTCAVGCLLSSDILDRVGTELLPVTRLDEDTQKYLGMTGDSTSRLWLLRRLQSVHDVAKNWENSEIMRQVLKDAANDLDLDGVFLDQLQFADGR